tara:strand:- start:828 stop:3248 length:2421 start_codon:yes stop_codon:yes gene_type:complete
MKPDDFTEQAQEIIALSQQIVQRYNHSQWDSEHIMMAFVEQEQGVASDVFELLGISQAHIKEKLHDVLSNTPRTADQSPQMFVSPRSSSLLSRAKIEADRMNDEFIGVEHLLVALVQEDTGAVKQIVEEFQFDIESIYKVLQQIRGGHRVTDPRAENKYGSLDRFSVDLTRLASQGKLDPVNGRDLEISRAMQTLIRRTKNNPVLIGGAGVGKTAVVEGLAQQIVAGNVPDELQNRRVLSLELGSMLAGAKFRGEFEERLKAVMDEIKQASGEIILFIDEIHTVVGAGASEGAIDASNMMKPALARGELQCIGATTDAEYRKHIEKDAALERRFQPVLVEEPKLEVAIDMLRSLRARYESHHKVKISDEALDAAARLSQRYITERHLPDKAVDLIDEAASKIRIESQLLPNHLKDKENRLIQLQDEEESASQRAEYQTAAEIRTERLRIKDQFDQEMGNLSEQRNIDMTVTADDIGKLIATWTGIPVDRLLETEAERLLYMEERLHDRLIGQESAVNSVADAVRRSRAGLKDPDRPIGSFIFLGPTGVGKTELARALAQYLFDDEQNMIRVDMSEYMEQHAVSRLIGSPPGYVGYEEGGQLTEAVRRRPFRVVLFDEIEKAHPDVFNILLQILEDGRLTDGQGRTVDFRHTLIIITSNLGTSDLSKPAPGFRRETNPENESARMRTSIESQIKNTFRPEFLNRIDEIIIFETLSEDQIKEIVNLMTHSVQERLLEHGVHISLTEAAQSWIALKGFDPVYGARPLRRVIQRELENKLARRILVGEFSEGDKVTVDVSNDELNFERNI